MSTDLSNLPPAQRAASRPVPVALTIAGSDSGGGAGIQADLKTFTVLGVYGMSAITAITVQNTEEVRWSQALSPDLVTAQIDAVMDDIGCDAAKTGMLVDAPIVSAVADRVRLYGIANLVVDPVMIAKSGDALLQASAREAVLKELLPLARVVTPNLHEAAALTGLEVEDLTGMREAARRIAQHGPEAVIVKGGHLDDRPLDLVYLRDTGEEVLLEGQRFDTKNTHGTGCTFSAAIAAGLASGLALIEAIKRAKEFISLAIENGLELGHGHGPTGHIEAGRRLGGCS
ncbi:bifunctional hydroxymethylpyrimidine kinase/phosphomethylpyrimidine kinase [bacterium]|nr:bifunctional hydroxymethylpyrimidine kinase/phosphomethylpyrimidine kinase [bacterium]